MKRCVIIYVFGGNSIDQVRGCEEGLAPIFEGHGGCGQEGKQGPSQRYADVFFRSCRFVGGRGGRRQGLVPTVTEPPRKGVRRQDQLERFLAKREHNQHT
jgi:hypothetical protein